MKIMKTKKFLANGVLPMSAFLFASAVIMVFWSLFTFTQSSKFASQQEKMDAYCINADQTLAANTLYGDPNKVINDENSIQVINQKISKLEQERAQMTNKLKKAKADRNKNYGMVAGMYFQPSQDLAEIINFEGKVKKVDHKIAALKKKERNLAEINRNEALELALK